MSATATHEVIGRVHLTSTLSHLTTNASRAKRCLELLIENSGAKQGFLYTFDAGALVLASSIADHPLPPAIEVRAGEFLSMLSKDEETTNDSGASTVASSMWTLPSGVAYHPVVLSRERPNGNTIIGLAVLVSNYGEPFRPPAVLAAEIAHVMPTAMRV